MEINDELANLLWQASGGFCLVTRFLGGKEALHPIFFKLIRFAGTNRPLIVILSEAKDLARWETRSFASLRMTSQGYSGWQAGDVLDGKWALHFSRDRHLAPARLPSIT